MLPYSRNDSHHPGRWRRLTQPLLRAQWERGSCHPTLPSHWELMPQQPPHRQPHQHTEAIPVSWEHRARMCCQKVEHSLVRMPASSFHTPLKTQTPVVPRDTSQCTPKGRPQGTVLWPQLSLGSAQSQGTSLGGGGGGDLTLFSLKFNIQINICMCAQNIHCGKSKTTGKNVCANKKKLAKNTGKSILQNTIKQLKRMHIIPLYWNENNSKICY